MVNERVRTKLVQLFGQEHVTADAERLSSYFYDGVPSLPLLAVFPRDAGQVSQVVQCAREESTPLFTRKDAKFASPLSASGGIILDFTRMNAIERIDERNLTATIQRGVTWEQLQQALEGRGLKTLLPAASTSPLVLEDMASRVIMRSAARYPEVQISNLQVVLADGRVHLTGSHSLAEDGCDSKDDGGPNLSKWYIGAEDIYGIPVRATIWLYPIARSEEVLLFGFQDLQPALEALRNIPRKELCDQALVMNAAYARQLLGGGCAIAWPWLFLAVCEGVPTHTAYLSRAIRSEATALGGMEMKEGKDPFVLALGRVWCRPRYSHGFYTFVRRVPEFYADVASWAPGPLAALFVSHGYGRAAWCQFDHLEPHPEDIGGRFEAINLRLLARGAFFDRPLGSLADKFYAGNPAYVRQMKRIKTLLDPARLLNPDQLLTGV